MLTGSRIGLVPLNWKYETANQTTFLAGIADYGFEGIQISGDQADSTSFLREMEKHHIAPAEQYVAIRCGQGGPLPGSDEETQRTIAQALAAQVEMLVFAVDGTDDRDRCAGRADAGPQMSESGFKNLAMHVERHAKAAALNGIKSSFHPHAATYVESANETALLMTQMDSEIVGLCLDVGHWIVGGADPIKAVKDYGVRITHIHVKDVSQDVLAQMLSGKLTTMSQAVDEFKLFVPAGTGMLDLAGLFHALDEIGYKGWLMSEQDSAWPPSEAASGISIANMRAALAS